MVAHLAWGCPTTWGTLAVVASLAATTAHGAPASDRLGRGDELDALAVLLHGQGQESYGPRMLKRQVDAPQVVTQTVFSTYVQTATQTLFTTVSPTQEPGYGATPSSSDAAILSSVVPIASASPAPIPTDSSSDAQSTSSSSPGAGPVLFMPPGQPDLPTPTLMPSSGAENNKPPSPSPTPSKPPPSQQKPLMMAYYPEWAAGTFPPEKVDFQRYDWVDFAFAVPQQDFSLGWDGSDDAPDLLRRLVASAHNSGKKAKLSVGGWTGSKYFSSAVSTAQNRQILASSILAAYKQFNLDGIEIDWEYPAQAGNEQNNVSPVDTGNYLLFLQLLRRTLPPTAKITAATMTVPWADARGNPLRDVSGFAKVLDWILIMNYDTWGSSANPGPNAPLSNGCHNSTQSGSSAVAGVATWTAAGFPANKIVMGMPSYGYISRSSASYLQSRSVSRARTSRRSLEHVPMHIDGSSGITADSGIPLVQSAGDDSGLGISAAGTNGAKLVMNEDGGTADGQVQFRGLIKQGILQYIPAWSTTAAVVQSADAGDSDDGEDDTGDSAESGNNAADGSSTPDTDTDLDATINTLSFAGHTISNVFTALCGFERKWDACSSTPYLRSASAQQVVSYDDPQSLEMKAVYARYAGLLGVNMFDIHGDTDQWDLTDALRRGLGL